MNLLTKLYVILLIAVVSAYAQNPMVIELLPDEDSTVVGEVCFLDLDYPGTIDTVCIKAPNNVTTSYDLTLPAAAPAGTECLQMSSAGVVTTTGSACGTGSGAPFVDTTAIVKGSVTDTKLLRFEVDGFTAATTRTLTPQNADYTIAGINIAQTFTANQTLANTIDLLCATDGGCDIGANATRIGAIYTDTANAEFMQISDAAHSVNFTIELGGSGLDIDNTSGTRQIRFTGTYIEANVDLDPSGAATLDIGNASSPWDEVWADDFKVEGPHATDPVVHIYEAANAGSLDVYDDNITTPVLLAHVGGDLVGGELDLYEADGSLMVAIGSSINLYNSSASSRAQIGVSSDDGYMDLDNSSSATALELRTDGVGCTNCGGIRANNASGTTKMTLGINTGGAGQISLVEASGSSTVDISASGTTPDLEIEMPAGGALLPDSDSDQHIGSSSLAWDEVYGNFFHTVSAAGECRIFNGSGAPAGACTTCDMVLRTDGGSGTTLYVCESSSWVAK